MSSLTVLFAWEKQGWSRFPSINVFYVSKDSWDEEGTPNLLKTPVRSKIHFDRLLYLNMPILYGLYRNTTTQLLIHLQKHLLMVVPRIMHLSCRFQASDSTEHFNHLSNLQRSSCQRHESALT